MEEDKKDTAIIPNHTDTNKMKSDNCERCKGSGFLFDMMLNERPCYELVQVKNSESLIVYNDTVKATGEFFPSGFLFALKWAVEFSDADRIIIKYLFIK